MSDSKNIEKDFLNGEYEPHSWRSVHECWFLNGQTKKWMIRFFKDALYSEFFVSVVKNNQELPNFEDDSIYGNWDVLLIKLFGLKYSVRRNQDNNLEVFRASDSDSDERFQNKSKLLEIKKNIVSQVTCDRNSPQDQRKCSNLIVNNQELIISQIAPIIECSSCRLALIYILANAYVYKLDEFVRRITANPKLAIKTYSEMQDWKTRYFYRKPLQTNRVIELFFMWEDLYTHFGIEDSVREMEEKLREISRLENSKKIDRLNNLMLYLSIVATLSTLFSLVFTIWQSSRG
ncbi:hypothetical protein [Succinivibrio sp.]|uniref:hypothetical protein n=1 Tax=Succinivibrio sp. TaxID=2053619 RepID=UPI0025E68B23|nr:hypothetical protein [Succinivibrio sp.]MBQ9219941.1 hypothetical protein [Succinivibrio sp.]